MKRKKLLLLTILILTVCTGCDIEYNINITKDNVSETIIVNDYITDIRTEEDILSHYKLWYPTFVNYIPDGEETIEIEDYNYKIDGIEYHDKTINKINNGYKYTYKYNYNIDKYYDSYALANVYGNITVYQENDSLVLRTSKENYLCQYDYFNSVKINITIDPKVYELNYTNSSKKNNNTYTWELNRNNCDESQIILTLNKLKDNIPTKEEPKKKDYSYYIFCGILLIVMLSVYLFFNQIKDKNNDI